MKRSKSNNNTVFIRGTIVDDTSEKDRCQVDIENHRMWVDNERIADEKTKIKTIQTS